MFIMCEGSGVLLILIVDILVPASLNHGLL
jgi:hypothetical protein